MSDSEQSRKHKRYSTSWVVEIKAPNWTHAHKLVTDNVSRGGLFIRSQTPPEKGVQLWILLKLPDGTSLQVAGEVVHSISEKESETTRLAPGFGLRFDEQYAIDLNLLEGLAASNAAGEHCHLLDERYITLPAILSGINGETSTTVHQLTEEPQGVEEPQGLVELEEPESSGAPEVHEGSGAQGELDDLDDLDDLDIPITEDEPADSVPAASAAAADPPVLLPPSPREPTAGSSPPPSSPVLRRGDAAAEPLVFGIDFGTSYTSIAISRNSSVEVLHDDQGRPFLPSVVCYPDRGAPIVGWPAREKLATCPSTTISSTKRLIGRRYDHKNIQPLLAASAVHMEEGPGGQVIARIYGDPIAIPQISAEIFRTIANLGEQQTHKRVERAVLSTPVGYEEEKVAIKRAAQLAGIEVVGMIDEPVAAALAYGLNAEQDHTVAIYDFGGGTFDFSLLNIKAGKGFSIIGSAGDPWLGGDDFDHALADYAADVFWRKRKIDIRQRQVEWQLLQFLAETAKLRLSGEQEVELLAKGLLMSIHGPVDLRVPLNREIYWQLCGPLVERSIETVDDCLSFAGIKPEEIEHVVLIGGTSRSPIVRQRLQEYFKREITLKVDPELAIVIGNAIYGRYLAQKGL